LGFPRAEGLHDIFLLGAGHPPMQQGAMEGREALLPAGDLGLGCLCGEFFRLLDQGVDNEGLSSISQLVAQIGNDLG
jgi:hypothetical protein